MDSSDERAWAYIKSLGLKPEIDTLENYLSAVDEGLQRGRAYLRDMGSGPFTPKEIMELHKEIFGQIHEWAGTPRQKSITIDDVTGTPGSDPDKIIPDLEGLTANTKDWFQSPKNDLQGHAEELAGYHIALHQIKPFEDGNGRVIRLILDHQMDLFQWTNELNLPDERRPEIAQHREKYLEACVEAVQKQKLGSLSNLILDECSLSDKAKLQEIDLKMQRAEQELKERERERQK